MDILRWQAPRVGCLNFHSLLELRRGLQYGSLRRMIDERHAYKHFFFSR